MCNGSSTRLTPLYGVEHTRSALRALATVIKGNPGSAPVVTSL